MVLRCLLVDDNAGFLAAARSLLERQGVEVDVASTGSEAVRRTSGHPLDVVLVDLDLGGESGFEVAHRIHEISGELNSPGPGVRIILISTHAENDFEELIEQSPALGFLPKSSLSVRAIQDLLRSGQS
jgi:two-component system, NarL family, nitrate/nitrite response regulator NarL